jgi:hypothetical protein
VNHKSVPQREPGYILVSCLSVVVVTTVLVLMFFSFGEATQRSALKRQYQGRAGALMEVELSTIHRAIATQLQSVAQVETGELSTTALPSPPGIQNGMYELSMSVRGRASVIKATETHSGLTPLSDPEDPFRGAKASTAEIDLTGILRRLGSTDPSGNYDFVSLRSNPVISIRQIPLSEFSLYSGGGSLTLSSLFAAELGRIYVNGDFNVTRGTVRTSYPVTAAGNVTLSNGAVLEARSDPTSEPIAMAVTSTSANEWLALAKSTQQSTVLTGRDLPMSMIQAVNSDELTIPRSVPASNALQERLRLWHQCSRIVTERSGRLTVVGGDSSEQMNYHVWQTRIYNAWGPPVIVFDAAKVAPGPGKSSFYISSSSATAAVYVVNASMLTGDLSIVTPHPILVSGGFNVLGAQRAASLITSRAVFAVP